MPPVDKPNYTQIPNAILDNMPSMSMPEFCVVMAICRQTFGWHKKSEKLSVTQLREMTGLSKDAVLRALEAALQHYCDLLRADRGALRDEGKNHATS